MRIIFFLFVIRERTRYGIQTNEHQTKIEKHGKQDEIEKQSNLDVVKMQIQEMAKEQFIVVVVIVDTIIINMLYTHAPHTRDTGKKT